MPSAKKREPIVGEKVKTAIRALFEQTTLDYQAAAKVAGLTAARLREEMKKPHVRRWAWHEKLALLDMVCAANPLALARIRDREGGNEMAKVQAIKTSEQMLVEAEHTTSGSPMRQTPGVTIIFESPGQPDRVLGPPPMRLIDSRPVPQLDPYDDAS
jgi:hypothetical protein